MPVKYPLQLITVGGSSTDPATRCVKWRNWQEVADLFTPWANGLMLRAVAGLSDLKRPETLTDIGESYEGKRLRVEVDTGDQARRDGMGWLVEDYRNFWWKWTDEHPGKKLISYLGAVPVAQASLSAEALWRRFYAPFSVVDKARVFIDCAAALKKDSPTAKVARWAKRQGIPVGIESLEVITQSHWAGYDVLTDHNRIRHAYDHPDGWQLARDVRKGGGTPYLGVVIDDKRERMECCEYWRHSDHGGWEIITYTHDLSPAEWEGATV